ncbi:STE/STE7/MEK1 protein kinase [Pholiota conissans]|uniref:STE/STE7/MEK1 protein kinase n=1 Tax=Pholiota conissans TaxID=109636 RepID=A0A9P5Z6T2_9AGAR|nr:STE/STE7/MEK1 protein kinase [Pholiota conissans]
MSAPTIGYVPSPPLRTKRNFKALVLPVEEEGSPAPAAVNPIATRPAPAPGKRRPPPLGENNGPAPGFILDPTLPAESPATGRRSAMHATLSKTLAKLDLQSKAVQKLGLKNEDLKKLADLGQGNGGSVVKVEHIPTGTIMAKKIVLIDAKSSVRKQILRELQIMHECHSQYIISCFGSFLAEPNICICMEFMDKGSFDSIYKKIGAIDINVVCLVANSVLEGLTYLYDVHRIIHRDIKPSNILLNSEGDIKLCDFGVSGELINSIANTFVGTSVYMSPERIQGAEYSVKSDVWSLGISLIELATGRFPFSESLSDDDDTSDLDALREEASNSDDSDLDDLSPDLRDKTPTHRDSTFAFNKRQQKRISKRASKRMSKNATFDADGMSSMSIIELMHQIVREPAPRLGASFSEEAEEFVDACLMKNPDERHSPKTLLEYRWMDDARDSDFDLKAWTNTF